MKYSYKIESKCDKECMSPMSCNFHTGQTFYAYTSHQAQMLKTIHQLNNEMAFITIITL